MAEREYHRGTKRGEADNKLDSMHNPAAEQSVLGLLLRNPALVHSVNLTEDDFYNRHHRLIMRCLGDASGSAVDLVALSDELHRKADTLVSPDAMLGFLTDLVQGSEGLPQDTLGRHAALVSEHAINRKLLKAGREIEALSVAPMDPDEKISRIEAALAEARSKSTVKMSRSIVDAGVSYVDKLERSGGQGVGVPSGFYALDDILTAFMPGDLIVLGGRPGMGKTSFAMNIAENVARRDGHAAGVFSMEMPDTQLAMRMLSNVGDINSKSLRSGNLSDSEWLAIKAALDYMKGLRLYVDDISGVTPGELRTRVKRMIQRHGKLSMLVVDYVQLMKKTDARQSETEAVTEFSGTLKAIAKEMGFPVLALAQLSRKVEERVDKRPIPADLRGSGSLEQDADTILFVYRDEVYNKNSLEPGIAEIIVGKNRAGPQGTARTRFNGAHTSFHNLDDHPDMDPGF